MATKASSWAANIYWLLRPFNLLINHLSLLPPVSPLVPLRKPNWWSYAHDADYRRYQLNFRMISAGRQSIGNPSGYKKATSPNGSDNAPEYGDLLRAHFSELKNVESLLYLYPQAKEGSPLYASLLWREKQDSLIQMGKFAQGHIVKLPEGAHQLNWADALHVYGDLELLDHHRNSPDERAIENLQKLQRLGDYLETVNVRNWAPCFVVGSFFADGIPDFAVFFPLKKDKLEHGAIEIVSYLEQVTQSLQPLVRLERRAFLYQWVYELRRSVQLADIIPGRFFAGDTADQERKRRREVGKLAEKIADMAATLLFRPDADLIRDAICAVLDDNPAEPAPQWEDRLAVAVGQVVQIARSEEELRSQSIQQFTLAAVSAVVQLCRARGRGKLLGSLSMNTTSDLVAAAENNCTRLLLTGAPGGGKGASAEDFHLFRMQEIARSSQRREKWLKSVAEVLDGVFRLPPAIRLRTRPDILRRFFDSQIAGTCWWTWPSPPEPNECPCFDNFGTDNVPDCNEDTCKFRGRNREFCQAIDSELGERHRQKAMQAEMYGFLSLLDAQLRLVEQNKRDAERFNLVQIPCGTLSGEGTPLVTSLERLFGDGKRRTPGIFQTCSYMGATLFLDEIADAPVPIQDNLLTALAEGKVSRRGWETIHESVRNVAIVSATHKDLRAEVRRFRQTNDSQRPVGFRPDLLTRLAQYPPINVRPISDYFVYDDAVGPAEMDHAEQRKQYRDQFVSILLGEDVQANEVTHMRAFWERVYDVVDAHLRSVSHARRFAGLHAIEQRKLLAGMLSMRLFGALKEIKRTHASEKEAGDAFVFRQYLPAMLDYFTDSE